MRHYLGLLLPLLIVSGMLQGCGFRLAGSGGDADHGIESISLQGPGSSRVLMQFTRNFLESNKIRVVGDEQASAQLEILFESAEKEVLSLDSDGKAREYDLVLSIAFDVRRPDDSYLLNGQSISLNRAFVFDKRDVLGSAEEEQRLMDEMRKHAARLIVYRLRAMSIQDE